MTIANAQPIAVQSVNTAGWRTVVASAIGLSVGPSCLTLLAFGGFIAPLEAEFKWGVPAISLGASIISIMIVILSPIQGALVDRFGGRCLILWSVPVFAASLAAMFYLPNNIIMFYLAWIVIPICGLGVWPISYLRSTAGWFDQKLGLALGFCNAGIGVGTMLIPLITAYLIGVYGWREAYLGLALLALMAWPVAYFLLSDPVPGRGAIVLAGENVREAATSRPFWIASVAFFLLGVLTSSIVVHQTRVMIDAGIPPTTATSIPAVFGLALLLARVVVGWLLDRFSAGPIMTILLLGGIVATVLYARGPSVPEAIVAAALVGAITGAEFDVLSFMIPRYHGRKSFGKLYGLLYAIFQLGAAIGIAALGSSRGSFGSYALGMYVLAGVSFVTALLFMTLGPYKYGADSHG
ncbi:MFS transporter [Bradyrhizobium jicamae]|uniref:MFS transporter n=1 Tax=Bradyrhizobium jicamae TaxID=280332 RepID=UPI001BA9414E|nr:MFS transporter [Bradyrhizobium jicamae]MBR0755291.1 MFS transporter [Bradyrhizobium jicamae]